MTYHFRWHIIWFLQNIALKLKQFNNCNIVTNIWGVTYCCHNNTCQFVVGQVVHAPGYFHLTNISGLHSRKLPEFLEKGMSVQAMPSLRTVLSRNVFSISFSSHNFQNFWLSGLRFRNFLLLRFSGNFLRNILTTTLNFQAWKVPLLFYQFL